MGAMFDTTLSGQWMLQFSFSGEAGMRLGGKILNLAIIAIFMTLEVSCAPTPAYAPTAPPQVNKNVFPLQKLMGQFTPLSNPTTFLWPVDRLNEETQTLELLTLQEQLEARYKITRYNEEVEILSAQLKEAEMELVAIYGEPNKKLESVFTQQKCYALCDPEDFLCDPEDEKILYVDTWLTSDDPEVVAQINLCQANQEDRQEIKKAWDNDKKNKMLPLQQQLGMAALSLLETIGDRNYINLLSQFQFRFNPSSKPSLQLTINWAGQLYSDESLPEAEALVWLSTDWENGFLQFELPWVENNIKKGVWLFDLEMVFLGDLLRVDGDLVQIDLNGQRRVGRFSTKGVVQ